MADKDVKTEQQTAQPKESKQSPAQLVIFLIVLLFLAVWGVRNPSVALRILAVMVGFGGIVIIHELGHFVVAKLGGIKVEAFSIGFPPVVVGIRKLRKGWRIRLLPKIGDPQRIEEGDNETEYQIGLVPIGGFVKMLGQSDSGAAEETNDPRSYANRPVWIRIATVSAGVVFNAIGAVIIFVILFMNGIDLKPAVVGQVVPNSPAYDAGLKPGDEIVEVNGERFVDFEAVLLAPVLSAPGEPVSFVVRNAGSGEEKEVKIIAEKQAGDPSNLRKIGISTVTTLTVEPQIARSPELTEEIHKLTGLYPADEIKAVNGQAVATPWDFTRKVSQIFQPQVALTVSRQSASADQTRTMVNVDFPMQVGPAVENFRDEYDLAHFCSMVPRLKVDAVFDTPAMVSLPGRIVNWVKVIILRQTTAVPAPVRSELEAGDIVLKIADQEYPNYRQLRQRVAEFKNMQMPVTVLRTDAEGNQRVVDISVFPRTDPGTDRVVMGIAVQLDMDSAVVAQVLPVGSSADSRAVIPAGATVIAVDGRPVENFYQIASILQENAGQKVSIDYQANGQTGGTAVAVPEYDPAHANAMITAGIPLEELTRRFKADNPLEAIRMGLMKTWQFVSRSYVTLGRLFQRSVPVSSLSGPVGILSMTYQVAGDSLAHYLYFLGLISSCLAVMNLLPLPVLDGGHIVFLIIEKITGKPIHERVLAPIMYIGLALLLGLILWISYHDVIRIVFG
jgi:regulator of sigma E protease